MPSVDEATGARTEFAADLAAGISLISQQQAVTFTQYRRLVLPVDGFAFWVKADLLSPSALLNTTAYNVAALNQPQVVASPPLTQVVYGSLHYSTLNTQDQDEGFAVNQVFFTSETEVESLETRDPLTMMIGEFDGLRFAFSRRRMLYRQARLFHYQGDALYPSVASQLVDSLDGFNARDVVVSNSLPFWLAFNKYAPVYPSFLVPDNVEPPYVVAHIEPGQTTALQPTPTINPVNSDHLQLVRDRVTLSMFGLRNNQALDLMDLILDNSLVYDNFGIMNMPVVRDEKRTQVELNVLAQRKTMELEVSYYQSRVRTFALQYIKSCFLTLIPSGGVNNP